MNEKIQKLLPKLGSIAVGVVPVFILIRYFGVSRKLIIGWGVLAYVVGVLVIKMPLYHYVVVRYLHGKLSNVWLSVAQGLVSACSELGAALLFFIFVVPDLTLIQLIGFGTAAGAVEAVMLPFVRNPLEGTPLEEHSSNVIEKSSSSKLMPWMGVVERILALFPHIATRGLLYVSVVTGNIVPGLIAVATFASLDGWAYFAHLEKWSFDKVEVLGKLYGNLALVALLQVLAFAGSYYVLM